MERFSSIKGKGIMYIFGETLPYNISIILLIFLTNSYEVSNLLKLALLIVNIYQLYYIFMCISLYYNVDNEVISIRTILGFKEDNIPFDKIQCYTKRSGSIKGVKLYGYGRKYFALGKSVIDKIGTAKMYATDSENIIYIKTEDISFGLSPKDINKFENILKEKGIPLLEWQYNTDKNVNLYKDKKFFIPFVMVAVIIVVLTLNPFILYLNNGLAEQMPLSFDAAFNPIKFGTGKQFAFKQMVYGVLNMALLFCMYYAAYFYARYDRKSAYKFISISLTTALLFLIMQIRILIVF